MDKTIVKAGQTWWDVGVELSGDWRSAIDLSLALGTSMTSLPPLGATLKAERDYNKPMASYCHSEGVSPATLEFAEARSLRIFADAFNLTFM